MNIGPYSIEDYLHLVKSFHGSIAPGLVIGGFMVDLARKNLPDDVLFDAISETQTCLPDAIQLLTPCTIGNGWLRVMDFGRYALCLYDKYQGNGVRVFLDTEKLTPWPEITTWLFKRRPKNEQDPILLRDQLIDAGPDILTVQHVTLDSAFLGRKSKGAIGTCPSCGEAYALKDGPACLACRGGSPYKRKMPDEKSETKPGFKIV